MENLVLMQLDPVRLSYMVAALVALSILLLSVGVRTRRLGTETLDDRVKRYAQKVTAEEIELSEPFFERAIKPLLQSLLRIVGRLAPQRNIEDLERDLARAGRPLGLTAIDFLGARLLFSIHLLARPWLAP
jgi:tight adherence protein C